MKIKANRKLAVQALQKLVIEKPCAMQWEAMSGDEQVRFCNKCNLNVYNISAMNVDDAGALLLREEGRPCVYMRRDAKGAIVTDNCPMMLKAARKRVALTAVLTVMTITYGLTLAAHAQNVAVPSLTIDPRYGQVNEIGQLADYGYDCARDISRLVTALSFVICCFVPMDKRITVKRALIELIGLALIPVLVHLIGTFFINNFGGLGGGLGGGL